MRRLVVWTAVVAAGVFGGLRYALSRPARRSMRQFDPERVASYEKEFWVAYYQRRFLDLGRLLLAMSREQFGLNPVQAIYAAFWATRAQIQFASQDHDVHGAQESMRRFYAFVRDLSNERYDPAEVARLELDWWVVHRQHSGHSDDPEVTAAVAALYAALYGVPLSAVEPAARFRALAMVASDRWVQTSRDSNSPLLDEVESNLRDSYRALRDAVS